MKSGRSALKRYEGKWGLAEPFVASCFDEDVLADIFDRSGLGEDYTRFEKMAIVATAHALGQPRGMYICLLILKRSILMMIVYLY